ncbi:SPOR domain-containing protein [Pseudoxanthomonas putridarboris]|uniref:SPOR domain-containing protein n=1 Tax=Pseudoxanthomonas putridarboris TaxID=752605 RepID=A0ABU9IV23_9GAMM
MLIRALIVLLIVLNLGVAAWWLTRPEPQPLPPPEIPVGVARLQLVDESQAPTPADTAPASAVVATAEPSRCFSLGSFTSEAGARQAQDSLQGQLLRAQLREVPGVGASGYQVVLPPAADREAAQATAARIGAAGFDDYLLINQGEQANGIALGRYRSREAAERRQSQLQAAGFPAQLQPVGRAGPSQWWLDAGAADGADLAALARTASTGTPLPLECTALR